MTDKREPVPRLAHLPLTIPKLRGTVGRVRATCTHPSVPRTCTRPPPFRVIIGTDILQTCRFCTLQRSPRVVRPWLGRDRTSPTLLRQQPIAEPW